MIFYGPSEFDGQQRFNTISMVMPLLFPGLMLYCFLVYYSTVIGAQALSAISLRKREQKQGGNKDHFASEKVQQTAVLGDSVATTKRTLLGKKILSLSMLHFT